MPAGLDEVLVKRYAQQGHNAIISLHVDWPPISK